MAEGELFVCGREKDLLILNGRNYFPDDIERVTAAIDGVREGSCVAFASLDASGKERAIVVAEGRADGSQSLEKAIVQAVRSDVGLVIDEVVLIKRGTLPKTSSGKARRKETKRRFEEGLLDLSSVAVPSAPPSPSPAAIAAPPGTPNSSSEAITQAPEPRALAPEPRTARTGVIHGIE